MKRLAVTSSLILIVVLALSFLYVSRVAATKVTPSVQMLSTSYSSVLINFQQNTTVETLSFSVTVPAKLEATSENFADTSGQTEVCEIALDGTTLIATPSNTQNQNSQADLTVTDTSVAAGSHTLTVLCEVTFSPISPPFPVSGSVSAIITTGL